MTLLPLVYSGENPFLWSLEEIEIVTTLVVSIVSVIVVTTSLASCTYTLFQLCYYSTLWSRLCIT